MRQTAPDDILREELARLLDAGGRPDASDALDVLWVARLSGLEPLDWSQIGDGTDPTAGLPAADLPATPPADPHPTPDAGPQPPSARLHLPGGTGTAPLRPGGAQAIRVTQPHALPDVLPLARALRPLRQTVASARTRTLDVEATAAASGDTGLLLPVLRPASELRFSVDLLIDTGMTMTVWHRLADELRGFLARHGAFADVRAWALHTQEPEPRLAVFRRGAQAASPTRRWRQALTDPTGRRAVLVLTDGVGPAWYGTELPATLAAWSRERPVAALQVLPSRLWHRTALRTSAVRARGTEAARATIEARSSGPLPGIARGRAGAADRARIRWLPVLEVSGPWLHPWARLVAARTTDWTPLLAAPLTVVARPVRAEEPDEPSHPGTWIERFEEGYSPEAFRLLRLLAAAPLSLPVMRLVQRTMLPSSTPMHLAEIFLSGLLVPRTPGGPGEDLDTVLYDFRDGVREALLDRLTRTESLRVLRQVMEGVSERVSETLGGVTDFAALVATGAEGGLDGIDLPEESRAFAEVALAVFSGVGGDYAELAARLGSGSDKPALSEEAGARRRARFLPRRRRRRGLEAPAENAGFETGFGRAAGPVQPEGRVPSRIPPLPEHYVRREQAAHVLRVLRKGSSANTARHPAMSPTTCVIVGGPGVGKTALAIACARELAAEFTLVRWISAHSREAMEDALTTLATDLGLIRDADEIGMDDVLGRLHAHFVAHPGSLLVYDGATPEVLPDRLSLMVASAGNGSVLITLSEGAPFPREPYEAVALRDFSRNEAMDYVRSALTPDRGELWTETRELADLVEATGTNPLVLAKAVADIKTGRRTVAHQVLSVLAGRPEVARFMLTLVWISQGGEFLGTGVVVRSDAVLTSVIDRQVGPFQVHRWPSGDAFTVTALHRLAVPGLTLLEVSEDISPTAFVAHSDDSSASIAVWAGQARPGGPVVRSVSRDVHHAAPGAAVIDVDGWLCSLVSASDGDPKTIKVTPELFSSRVSRAEVRDRGPQLTPPRPPAEEPLFYLSYSHRPPDLTSERGAEHRFFDDLSRHLGEMTELGESAPGFIDVGLPAGSRWQPALMRALAGARVFVPLYSPRYFTSDWCGREWEAFNRRQLMEPSESGFPVSAIVPVLWSPVHIRQVPPVARSIQYTTESLGRRYVQEGLSGLMRTTGSRPAYEHAVRKIAESIARVARTTRLRPCDPSLFDDLHNAFEDGDATGGRR